MFAFKFVSFLLFTSSSFFSFASDSTMPSQITLCKSDVFELIPIASIGKVEVFLYELGKPEFTAQYRGTSITEVLTPLNLNAPEYAGSVGTIITGKIILYFQLSSDSQARTKILGIGNGRVIEDQDCPGVLYFPNRKLDRSWLPEN